MNPPGRERTNFKLHGPDVSGFPLAFSTSFSANLNQSQDRASIDMEHVCRSVHPLPREDSIGRVDGGYPKSIASATLWESTPN
jgi:hypothetical protein